MRFSLRPLAFLFILTLPLGCSLVTHPPTLSPPPVEEIRLSNDRIRSLRGIASIELTYQGKRFRARQAIALAKPGLLRLETLNSLDQPLLILATDGVAFQAMSLSENRFYRGTVSEGLRHFIRLTMTSEEFVSLILGEVPPNGDASIEYDSDRGLFMLTFPPEAGWEMQTYWVHPKTRRVVEILKTNPALSEEIRVFFDRFRKRGSVTVPREVKIEIPKANNRIELNFREIEINLPLPQELFSLSIPPGVEVVELEGSEGNLPSAFPVEE